jgi:hypothetical protein
MQHRLNEHEPHRSRRQDRRRSTDRNQGTDRGYDEAVHGRRPSSIGYFPRSHLNESGDQRTGEWDGVRGQSFYGRGPKGYQRSDERIREEVCDILSDHSEIDASDIEVQVVSGEVTLKGEVASRRMKRLAEEALDDVRGLRDVINQLRIKVADDRPWQEQMQSQSRNQTGTTLPDNPQLHS